MPEPSAPAPAPDERAKAREEYRAARTSLNAYRSPTGGEDDEYHRRNARVVAAERGVPWYRRR